MTDYNFVPIKNSAAPYPSEDMDQDKDKELIKRILDRQEKMHTTRINHENLWQECFDYIVPRKGDVLVTRMEGDKRGHDNFLFDTTAQNSNDLLAGALHGMLTNPTTRFFDLIMGDPSLDDDEEVKGWLQDVSERMFTVIQNSNFQTEVHEIYIDQGAIGNACMFAAEHSERIVHFSARAMKEIFVEENNLGLVDIVHRVFNWKPRQIVQEFGLENVPEYVRKEYEKGCEDSWKIIHAVEPSSEGYESTFPFKSCYILVDKKIKLSEGGFKEFPYAVPRWTKTSGETYGRGPGQAMLPDIKMVNKMMETTLKGAQKTVDPPLMVSDDSVIGRVRLTPGGLTLVRPFTDVPIKPLITDARIDFGYQVVDDVRQRIRAGFYVDQLQLNEGPQMTATEVMQRTEEKLRLMGPVLGRQYFEFLRPVIERVFGIMVRKGMIPPAPEVIAGRKFDVRYSSLIARAQRMNDGQNFTRALTVLAPILQVYPETKDILNADAAARYVLDIYGSPHKLNNTEEQIKEIRDARAQAQAQLAQEAKEAHDAEVAGKVAPGAAQLVQAGKETE